MKRHPLAKRLIRRLGDASESTQQMWLAELEKTGAQTVAEPHSLLDEGDFEKRARAAYILGKVGDRRWSVARLLGALERPEHRGVRMQAAMSLAWLDAPATRRELVRVLKTHPEGEVRRCAAHALAFMRGGMLEVRALIEAFAHAEEEPEVRGQAASALGHPSYWLPRLVRESRPALLRALADPAPEVRAGAAYALGNVGGRAAVRAIEKLKTDEAIGLHGRTVAEAADVALLQIEVHTNPEGADEAWRQMDAIRRRG